MEPVEDIESMFQQTYGSSHLKFKEHMNPNENMRKYAEYIIKYIINNYETLTQKKLEQTNNFWRKFHI